MFQLVHWINKKTTPWKYIYSNISIIYRRSRNKIILTTKILCLFWESGNFYFFYKFKIFIYFLLFTVFVCLSVCLFEHKDLAKQLNVYDFSSLKLSFPVFFLKSIYWKKLNPLQEKFPPSNEITAPQKNVYFPFWILFFDFLGFVVGII